ncbi:hypothetical protein JN535_04575 [Cellulosimicrobium cellulans]|uniref:hypothetical protein n=1 Tax=Cellulosimicrobium cellulans TaxID=1710 RepID=UPI001966437A|nr:hypothetical protein [Cellulosimicrobium cellulans]MBN0039450.1 hypothetical protein [Cellulosimicrobium cellulans]
MDGRAAGSAACRRLGNSPPIAELTVPTRTDPAVARSLTCRRASSTSAAIAGSDARVTQHQLAELGRARPLTVAREHAPAQRAVDAVELGGEGSCASPSDAAALVTLPDSATTTIRRR